VRQPLTSVPQTPLLLTARRWREQASPPADRDDRRHAKALTTGALAVAWLALVGRIQISQDKTAPIEPVRTPRRSDYAARSSEERGRPHSRPPASHPVSIR
jgi:hypothetical protein